MILLFPIHPSAKTHAMFRRLFKKVRIPVTVNILRSSSVPEVARKLHAVGYSRGDFMCSLLAHRLISMAADFEGKAIGDVKGKVEDGHPDEVDQLLLSIHGVNRPGFPGERIS
jgi:2-methylisocitrate lyase-like PEP mutase family enzyme